MKKLIVLLLALQALTACVSKEATKSPTTEPTPEMTPLLSPEAASWDARERENVRAVLVKNKQKLAPCFQDYLKRNSRDKDSDITLNFAWTLDDTGKAANFHQTVSPTKDEKLIECISAEMSTWQFPKTTPGYIADIEFPFYFRDGKVKTRKEVSL